jgi:hypothetical protein
MTSPLEHQSSRLEAVIVRWSSVDHLVRMAAASNRLPRRPRFAKAVWNSSAIENGKPWELAKLISSETLKEFAYRLAEKHRLFGVS